MPLHRKVKSTSNHGSGKYENKLFESGIRRVNEVGEISRKENSRKKGEEEKKERGRKEERKGKKRRKKGIG